MIGTRNENLTEIISPDVRTLGLIKFLFHENLVIAIYNLEREVYLLLDFGINQLTSCL